MHRAKGYMRTKTEKVVHDFIGMKIFKCCISHINCIEQKVLPLFVQQSALLITNYTQEIY